MMNNFNRFPSSPSSRPLFPVYDRDYLLHAPNRSPFQQSRHLSNEFDLGRSHIGAYGSMPMSDRTRGRFDSYNRDRDSDLYNRQRFQSPREVHAKYRDSKDYNHGSETRLPLDFSETIARKGLEEQEKDNFSSYSSPNAFQNRVNRTYRDSYLGDVAGGMFENDFKQHNTPLKKFSAQNTLPTSRTKPTKFGDLDSDRMSPNLNNSFINIKKPQDEEMPDESILKQVQEIQNLQNLLKLSNNLALIDEISSNSSRQSPVVLDESSVGRNFGGDVSLGKQHKNFASVKDTFKKLDSDEELYENKRGNSSRKFLENTKSTRSFGNVKTFEDKKFVKKDVYDPQEDDLYSSQGTEKMLGNRATGMLSDIPKASHQSKPLFSTSLLYETKSSSCPNKKDDYDGLYLSIDKKSSDDGSYNTVPDSCSDGYNRLLSQKPQLPLTTFNTKLTKDADWSISKTIPFLCETPEDKVANSLKEEVSVFQDGIPLKSSDQTSSKDIGSDSCNSFLEDAIDVLVEKEAVVGLDYIIEYKNMVSKKGSLPFSCKLCNSSIGRLTAVSHVLGSKHRLNYLKAKDEETYRSIMSQKLNNKEKDEIISKAIIPLSKHFGRGKVIVLMKEIKEEEELPIPEDSLIEVFEESSINATSDEDAKMLTDDTNSSIKRSISENDKAVKILKVEKVEDIQENLNLDSETHGALVDDAQIKLNSKDSSEPSDEKPANLDDQEKMDFATESDNSDISWLLNVLANHSISSEEEADIVSKVIGVLLKSLLHFKLQTFKNVNLEQLMASLSNGSEEALLKLLALLGNSQQEAQTNLDTDSKTSTNSFNKNATSQNPGSGEETCEEKNKDVQNKSAIKYTVEMSDISIAPKTLPVLPSSDSFTISQQVTSVDSSNTPISTIPTSQSIIDSGVSPHTVMPTPVSQVSGLVPPPFFGWSNSPVNNLANQSPSKVPSNFAWPSPLPIMQMPGMPYYQQPAFQQSMAAYSGYPQYGAPVSQKSTATVPTGNFPPPRLPLITQPPPPPPPPLPPPIPPSVSNQPPLPSPITTSAAPPLPPPSISTSVDLPPPPPSLPPLPPMCPPPPPLP